MKLSEQLMQVIKITLSYGSITPNKLEIILSKGNGFGRRNLTKLLNLGILSKNNGQYSIRNDVKVVYSKDIIITFDKLTTRDEIVSELNRISELVNGKVLFVGSIKGSFIEK